MYVCNSHLVRHHRSVTLTMWPHMFVQQNKKESVRTEEHPEKNRRKKSNECILLLVTCIIIINVNDYAICMCAMQNRNQFRKKDLYVDLSCVCWMLGEKWMKLNEHFFFDENGNELCV